MKLQIELSEEQLALLINALEVNFRIMMEHGDNAADLLAELPDKEKFQNKADWDKAFEDYLVRRDNAAEVINALSRILYGKYQKSFPKNRDRLSDMWCVLRHAQYLLHQHDDGYDVRSWEPVQMSDYDMIKVDILEG